MTGTAVKIAWRDLRASWSKFLFVILAVAAGVGALTGVRGFTESFRGMLTREARTLMAADVFVRIFSAPSPEQEALLQAMAQRGIVMTRITETLTMVASDPVPEPALVTVKALDPTLYPLYGEVTLSPEIPLRSAVTDNSVVISDDLKQRLRVEVGQNVRVGGQPFRVAGILVKEPDRMSGSFSVGPRLMITRGGLERTGLIGIGSRASQRILFRLTGDYHPVEAELKKAFPEGLIVNYKELNPNVQLGLQRATSFLSLVSLIALIVGAIGVATAMHAHLQTRMDSIAVMKSVGGKSGQILRIYLAQTIMLGLAGGVVGVVFGIAVQGVFPALLEKFLQVKPEVVFTPASALQGMALGLLTTVLFTLPPLLGIREIRPSLILRRDMTEVRAPLLVRLRKSASALGMGLLMCLALAVVAASLVTGSPQEAARIGGIFVAGLVVSLIVLTATGSLLLAGLKLFAARTKGLPTTARHAIANLHRPGSQSRAVLTALGVGVMFTLTVYLVQRSVLDEIRRTAPPGMSNVFFLDITPDQKDELAAVVQKWPGVLREPEVISTVSCRLVAVNGIPVEQLPTSGGMRRFRMARTISSEATIPAGVNIVRGAWWTNAAEPQISIGQNAARVLKVEPGGTMTWDAFGKRITAKVAAIHRADEQRLRGMVEFYMTPGALEDMPSVYYAGARIKPEAVGGLQRVLYEKFPTVTVINVAEILDRVQEVVDQVALVIRFISAFAILAGAIILASSVAGTRFRRVREMAIFKALGATRQRIAAMFSAEFLILGTVAGLMGSLLATAFTWLVLKRFFEETPFRVDFAAVGVSILLTAVIAAISGWLAIFRVLEQKPLEVLRGE
ncbi:MAG: FtsX-like permease family protein [Bryobacteraceae bacterium]|nr:FtsX-like permease family protein [Bryobacteraceae bacterium]